MKKTIWMLLCIGGMSPLPNYVSAQVESSGPLTQKNFNFDQKIQKFTIKSKQQKKTAWILLGGGLAVNTLGSVLLGNSTGSSGSAATLTEIGSLATIASIPFFFASSKNKNKAQLYYFAKNISLAPTDSIRHIYLEDAEEYFKSKAASNRITAIILSGGGAALLLAGVLYQPRDRGDVASQLFEDFAVQPLLIVSGISMGVMSIPFYVRAGKHSRTAKMILRTGRIPDPELGFAPTFHAGKHYVAVGFNVQL